MTGMFADVMKMGIGLEMVKSMGGVMKDAMNSGQTAGTNMSSVMNNNTAQQSVQNPMYTGSQTAGQTSADAAGANAQGTSAQSASEWKCSCCGSLNPAASRFCGQCGTKRGE